MTSYNYKQIYDIFKNYIIANQDKLNDFNDGSIISTIDEAIARIVERFYIETRIGYTNNLKAIPYSIFDFEKKEGQKATAKVVFSRDVAIPTVTEIPINTQIAAGNLIFITTEKATINANELNSNSVGCQAENIGSEYNVTANKITVIESIVPSDVKTVTNSLKAVGGADSESDTDMLSRFKDFINGLQGTNYYGLKSAIMQIPGVKSVNVIEKFPPVNGYNLQIYVDEGEGTLTDKARQEIEDVLNGDEEKALSGCRSAGIKALVSSAAPENININIKVSIYRTDHSTAEFDITNAIRESINSLTIGEDVLSTNIIMRLRQIEYVKDITDIKINNKPSFGNLEIADNSVARFNSVIINFMDV